VVFSGIDIWRLESRDDDVNVRIRFAIRTYGPSGFMVKLGITAHLRYR